MDRMIKLGTIIAQRTLRQRDAPRRRLVVSLGAPRRTPDTEDWECPFQISGAGMRCFQFGRGVDAFQALTVALQGIRYYLDRSELELSWPGILEGQTGFQQIIPLLTEAAGARRMERVVERELQARLKRLKQRHARRLKIKAEASQHRRPRARATTLQSPQRDGQSISRVSSRNRE